MPYALDHTLLTAHGSLPGGEIWSCGIRYGGQPVQTDLQLLALKAADRWRALASSLANQQAWSKQTTLSGVTARLVSTQGLTLALAESSPTGGPYTPDGPTTVNSSLPNQCATVVSLITGRAGRTGKGRIYLPLLALGVDGGGRHQRATQIAAQAKILIDGINADGVAAGFDNVACIICSQVGAGSESKIISVRVGDVIDTQRRRRDGMPENYSSAVLA